MNDVFVTTIITILALYSMTATVALIITKSISNDWKDSSEMWQVMSDFWMIKAISTEDVNDDE